MMNFSIHHIGGEYVEMKVDEIETGLMDSREAGELALEMLSAVDELLGSAGIYWAARACVSISDGVAEHMELSNGT